MKQAGTPRSAFTLIELLVVGEGCAAWRLRCAHRLETREAQGPRRFQQVPDRLNDRYADPTHPMLHATVEAKANHLPAFELTDAGPFPGQ